MNDYGRRYLIEQINRHDGRRDRRRDREDRDYDDYERDYETDDRRGRSDDYEDGRRGMKGTGRGRRYDRGESMRLSNFDMMRWKKKCCVMPMAQWDRISKCKISNKLLISLVLDSTSTAKKNFVR